MVTLRIALLSLLLAVVSSDFRYDNEIIGEPEIECGHGVVSFKVKTAKGQASQVFVRGNSENKDCVFHNTGNVTIDLSKCNIRRKREANPTGITYAMTVIVQLHPLFVTKVDRAYNVNCFYMEKKQDVNIEFGVSDITTQSIAQDAAMPQCTYSIHRDSPNGPIIAFSKVGEIIYHKWECPSTMYKMLLTYCKVVDGKGKEYSLQDENGCSTDRYLFPEVTYSDDVTTAVVETAAFIFPDQTNLAFACKIRLCYFGDHCDSITPPRCGADANHREVELNGDALQGNDLSDDQLISSTTSDVDIGTTGSAEDVKSTERAFAGDTEATTFGATSTTTEVPTSTTVVSSSTTEVPRSTSGAPRTTSTTTASTTTHSTTRTSSTTTTKSTTAVTPKGASSTKLFIPADFPRPDALESQEGSGEVDAWMVSDIPEASENRNESHDATAPPVQVLKKNKKRTPHAERPTVDTTTARAASRQQRNATPRPQNLVDMDVTRDITIIDDYINNAESATQAQKQVYRDINETPFGRGVCFSPVALLCGALLLLLLIVSVIFVLFRTRRTTKYYGA
ncbi:unnamed protein product [Bursaphelenchus okinawaensis]|uniref:ZP domain-containing protein n=1 Tax=Bursaphelenchus okinawaensis TaxID=465554 RepID=A0A811KBL6_9BILA|nr:unnamed protein product [Bursaphelenchus okinawaensis]CAG9097492.1 unnamed protein product [Bursaphelenchus okinawaensis]